MARTARATRLVDANPDQIAGMVEHRLWQFAALLVERLGLGELPRASRDGSSSPVALETRTLVLYAVEGPSRGSGGRAGATAMREACGRLAALLYGCAIEEWAAAQAVEGATGYLDDLVVLTLVAAWARAELALGRGLTARQLGALAGVDARSVRRFGAELALAPDEQGRLVATPERATSWLRARGVRGLPKERGKAT